MATKAMVPGPSGSLVEEPLKLPVLWNRLVQPHMRKFHGFSVAVPTCMEVFK